MSSLVPNVQKHTAKNRNNDLIKPCQRDILSFWKDDFDINNAITKARQLGIREDCITSLQLSYIFLLSALKTNLTLCDIAKKMIYHQKKTSEFESLVNTAIQQSNDKDSLLQSFTNIVSNHFQQQ